MSPPSLCHHMTVCVVPPPDASLVWKVVTKMRQQLKDPGFYRWPPHANLLYPFLDSTETLEGLQQAASQVEPFRVTLSHLGTFGGNKRGVLWLSPETDDNDALHRLHHHLVEAFPICLEDTKHTQFTPHMTLSHFERLEDALLAQQQIEADYQQLLPQLEFELDTIYLLRRQGDGGQFLRVADIGLGQQGRCVTWDPPLAFPNMPVTEEDWVYEERMKLKQRRNKRGKRGSFQRSSRPREPRIPDTPEVIAAKRAERQAKRERALLKQEEEN